MEIQNGPNLNEGLMLFFISSVKLIAEIALLALFGQWVLGLDGKIAGTSDSAAHVLAILKRAAAIARAEGREVSLVFSATLRAAAHQEAADNGMEFEAFQEHLVAQMNKAEPGNG